MILDLFRRIRYSVDWLLFGSVLLISVAGILTMNSFGGESVLFTRQIIWLSVSIPVLFGGQFGRLAFFKTERIDHYFVWSFLFDPTIFVCSRVSF